eukprot:3290553-Prymnesium_polylepis.1
MEIWRTPSSWSTTDRSNEAPVRPMLRGTTRWAAARGSLPQCLSTRPLCSTWPLQPCVDSATPWARRSPALDAGSRPCSTAASQRRPRRARSVGSPPRRVTFRSCRRRSSRHAVLRCGRGRSAVCTAVGCKKGAQPVASACGSGACGERDPLHDACARVAMLPLR